MNLTSLIFYGLVNIAMLLTYLGGKNRIYEFPFWAGAIALGWFFPQAIGGFLNSGQYPAGAYSGGMFFASLCTIGLWVGYNKTKKRIQVTNSWLDISFAEDKLYVSGAVLCCLGYYFQWKLQSLPEEMLASTQWSGATVKYLFLASIGKVGFLVLWLMYISGRKLFAPKLLIFVMPGLYMAVYTAFVQGRRAGMMNLVSYVLVGLWFCKRIIVPRSIIIAGLVVGITLVNSIGIYRDIMRNKDVSLVERFSVASKADYTSNTKKIAGSAGPEFNNYIIFRQVYSDIGKYDFGAYHWNGTVGNFVPSQLVGRAFKQSLIFPVANIQAITKEKYRYSPGVGSTVTGYCDAFGSFGWFGFIKFIIIGSMMGVLYRHAMSGSFLGKLLYVNLLSTAMHGITHVTQTILVSSWIYFFALGFPIIWLARNK